MAMGYLVEVEPGRVKLRQQVGIPRGRSPLCRVVSRSRLHDYADVERTGRRSTCITIVVCGERPPFPHRLVAAETTLPLPRGAEVLVERCFHHVVVFDPCALISIRSVEGLHTLLF